MPVLRYSADNLIQLARFSKEPLHPDIVTRCAELGILKQNTFKKTRRCKRAGKKLYQKIDVVVSKTRPICKNTYSRPQVLVQLNSKNQPKENKQFSTKFASLNIQSARPAAHNLHELVIDNNVDVLALSETWLYEKGDENCIADLTPKGYTCRSFPRKDGKGGGIAFVLRKEIDSVTTYTELAFSSFECIKLTIKSKTLLCVYRPPPSQVNKSSHPIFREEFQNLLDSNTLQGEDLTIFGDLNVHFNKPCQSDVKLFKTVLDEHNLDQWIEGPTHKIGNTLDVLITDKDKRPSDISVVDNLLSDHKTIYFALDIFVKKGKRQTVETRDLRKTETLEFSSDLKKSCENFLVESDRSTQDLVEGYNNCLKSVLDSHAPVTVKRVSDRDPAPWIGEAERASRVERRKAEEQWRLTLLEIHRQIYQAKRAETKTLFEFAKKLYFEEKFESCTNSKQLFQVLDNIQGKNNNKVLPNFASEKDLSQIFSDFFDEKIEKIRENLDSFSTEPVFNSFCGTPLTSFTPVTENVIKSLISHALNKTCALDPAPTELVKKHADTLIPVIVCVINSSLSSGVVPSDLKQAYVTPLLKKQGLDQNKLANYRPVSNLSFLSKLLERVVLHQLQKHLNDNDLIEKRQSAYLSSHSTETALLDVTSNLLDEADKGHVSILSLLDLSAAFDTIDHNILLQRLGTTFGIREKALAWFESYISDRHQTVVVSNFKSKPVILKYGVPQGSVLGPILFSLYTQPLANIITDEGCDYHKFADDTQIGTSSEILEFEREKERLEECIDKVGGWMKSNKLKLNEEKTEAMLMGTKSKCDSAVKKAKSIEVGGNDIFFQDNVKNLGVFLDPQLGMKKHVSNICRSAYLEIRRVGKIRKFLTVKTATRLACSRVLTRLDYCNSLLGGVTKDQIQRLQRAQNSAARMVLGKKKRDHVKPLLAQLHWLPVEQRIQYKIGTLAFRHFDGTLPPYLSDKLSHHTTSRTLRSSAQLLLNTPQTNLKTAGDRSFRFQTPHIWNSIPLQVRQSQSLTSFKKNMKTYLFKSVFY